MDMIGLCHSCYTTNVDIQLIEGFNVCENCMVNPKIIQLTKQRK